MTTFFREYLEQIVLVFFCFFGVLAFIQSVKNRRKAVFFSEGRFTLLSDKGQNSSAKLMIYEKKKIIFVEKRYLVFLSKTRIYRFKDLDFLWVNATEKHDGDNTHYTEYSLILKDNKANAVWSCYTNQYEVYLSLNEELCRALEVSNYSKMFDRLETKCKNCERSISKQSISCLYCGAKIT